MSILIILLLVTAGLIGFMCLIWMLALGFQRHWGWGLAMLFPLIGRLVSVLPLLEGKPQLEVAYYSLQLISLIVYLSFVVVAWPDTKPPFFWQLTSWLLLTLGLGLFISSHTPPDSRVQAILNKQGVKPSVLDWIRAKQEGSDRLRPPAPRTAQTRSPGQESAPPVPTPPPVFRSRLPPPRAAVGQREAAQPGIYYLLERVTTKTPKGVLAGLPGEKVILLERLSGGRMRVTVGDADFVVYASQVTDDVSVARELEKQDFVARGGQL